MIDNEPCKILNFHIKKCFYNNRNSQKYISRKYYSHIESICDYYSIDEDEFESLINQCFLTTFKNISPGKIYDDVSFRKYLRKQAVCQIVNHCRKNFRHQEIINFQHDLLVNPGILWKSFLSKISPAFQKKSQDEIHRIISCLTSSSRIILNLMALEDFNYRDLAYCFGITTNMATENVAKAIDQVKNIMVPLSVQKE